MNGKIQLVLLGLVLVASYGSSKAVPKPMKKHEVIGSSKICKGHSWNHNNQKTGDYLRPHDSCRKFWSCDAAGRAHEMDCPSGLHWDNKHKICNWPELANCHGGGGGGGGEGGCGSHSHESSSSSSSSSSEECGCHHTTTTTTEEPTTTTTEDPCSCHSSSSSSSSSSESGECPIHGNYNKPSESKETNDVPSSAVTDNEDVGTKPEEKPSEETSVEESPAVPEVPEGQPEVVPPPDNEEGGVEVVPIMPTIAKK